MAGNNSDGSITIDTELDNDGFEKGSKKLLSAIEDLTGAVDNLGDNMMRSFQQVIPLLQSIANSASSTYQLMASEGQQVADTNDRIVASQQAVNSAAQATADAVDRQGQAVQNMGAQTADATQATQNAFSNVQQQAQAAAAGISQAGQQAQSFGTNLSEAVSSSTFSRDVNTAQRSCDALTRQVEKIADAARIGFNTDTQIEKFQIQVEKARDNVSKMEAELQRLGSQTIKTKDYEDLEKATQKAEQTLLRLYDRRELMEDMGVKESSAQWKRLALQIQYAEENLARYENSLAGMQANGTAYVSGGNTAEYAQMAEQVSGASSALAELEQVAAALGNSNPAVSAATRLLGGFGTALRAAGSAALYLAKNLAVLTFKGIAAGVKAVTGKLKEFVSQSKQTALTSNALVKSLTSLKTMLLSRIKRMFISAIFSQMKEALNSLTQVSGEFNRAMSNMKNSATELSANMASAFSNLIMAVEPVITKIISALSTAMSYLNAFFSMLGGKKTMVVAKKQTASYADSVNDAAKGAKELNRQLMGFDEINRMEKKDSGSSGGAGGSGGDLFEEVPIDSVLPAEVAAYFERLKTAIQNGDWEGVGRIIAEGLNSGMAIVDNWINTVLHPMGVKWSERIAQILNGLVDGFDWRLLGKTVADGINSVFDIINTFLTSFDFEKLGTGIGTAVNGLFDNIDWGLLGETFSNKWNALINTVYGIVNSVDWAGIGLSLSTFLNSFVNNTQLDKAALAIAKGLNGIRTSIQTFIDNTDWVGMATKVGNSVNTLFSNVDWYAMGSTVTSGFNTVVKTLATFIGTVDWGAIGNDIAQFIQGLVSNIDWANIGKLLSNFFSGVLGLIGGIIEGMDWVKFGSDLLDGLITMITNIDWLILLGQLAAGLIGAVGGAVELLLGAVGGLFSGLGKAFEGIGLDSIAGFFKGIGNALKDVGSWIKKNIVDPVVNAVKDFFGIHSPSTVFADIGDNLIAGLFNGISNAWGTITGFFDSALSGLSSLIGGTWENIKGAASSAWNDKIAPTLSGAWSGIKGTATSIWTNVKDTVSGAFTNTKDSLSNTAQVIGSNLSGAWSSVSSSATGMWDKIKSTVTSKFTGAQTSLSGTAQLMQSTLSQKFSGMLGDATQKFEGIRSALDRASTNSNNAVVRQFSSMASSMIGKMSDAAWSIKNQGWSSVGSNICSGIQSGINSGWSWLSRTVSSLASSLLRSAKNALGIHSPSRLFRDEVGENVGLGWAEGIEGTAGTVLKTVANVAKSITANAEAKMPELQYSGDTLLTGLDAVASKLSGVADIFQNITNMLASLPTLSVPDISVGTVVPYRAKVEDIKSQNEAPTASVGGQMDLIDALQQMFEMVIQAIENKDNSVVIGDDVIYNAYNRAKQRMSMIRGTT